MSLAKIFQDTITKLTSIKVRDKVIANPVRANNFAKTISNVNNVFKYINIWDNQIDEMIKGTTYSFDSNSAIFIELQLGEGQMLLNNVTSYPNAKIIFHIFSILLDAGKDNMEQNLKIFEFRDILKSNTLGWSPANCSSFMAYLDTLDYKHNNITKHLLGYNFNFIDKTGSIFDEYSPNYLNLVQLVNATVGSITIFQNWKSGLSYFANSSCIINGYDLNGLPLVYLCTIDNSDEIFNIANWLLIQSWKSGKSYEINDTVYVINRVYKCTTINNDNIFNPDNWEIIQ